MVGLSGSSFNNSSPMRMGTSELFKSCASPPARAPMVSILCARNTSASDLHGRAKRLVLQQLEPDEDGHERIIQIMRQPTRKGPDGFHPLRAQYLGFRSAWSG